MRAAWNLECVHDVLHHLMNNYVNGKRAEEFTLLRFLHFQSYSTGFCDNIIQIFIL